MNLSYVKNYLQDRVDNDNVNIQTINTLLEEIKSFQSTEESFQDIALTMRVINGYNMDFLTKVQEFEIIPKEDMKSLPKRADKVREILCTLSKLHTYLVLSVNNIKESNFNMKNLRTYVNELNEKKEHFKSEKVTWATILRSLSQEMAYASEMRKMDIEDKVGYLKYKDN